MFLNLKFFSWSLIIFFLSFSIINSVGIFDYSHIEGSSLSIQAGKITSKKGVIPYHYSRLKMSNFKKISKAEDTIGEILTGEQLYTTGHEVYTNQNKLCQILCSSNFTSTDVNFYTKLVNREYTLSWYLDKLPAGLLSSENLDSNKPEVNYFSGIPLGYKKNGKIYIYNHLQFRILLNDIGDNKFNVVGFNILPSSVEHVNSTNLMCDPEKNNNNINSKPKLLEKGEVVFTYDTIFEYSNITIASRWDHYKPSNKKIHWVGIGLSYVLISVLSFLIILFLSRSIKKDIDNYNYQIFSKDGINSLSWKQISGDVFRPPKINKMLFCSFLGTGIQLFFMLSITLILGLFGFMNPEKRTNVLNCGIILFCFMGLPGGFISANIYKIFGGYNWLANTLLTAILFPGTLLLGFIFVNFILTLEKSAAAVRVYDFVSLFFLWIFCTFPMILIGSFLGIKSKKIKFPCKVNSIPSIIPSKPWYLHYRFISFIGGLLCFLTIFIEFSYVMASIWKHQIYFMATFLWMSFFVFVIVTGEFTILIVYWNLCWGDYNWWWKSFIMGSSPVIYFIAYSIYYFFYLKITHISAMVVYFGIMGLISAIVFFISGTTSSLITLGFVFKIYSAIKMD